MIQLAHQINNKIAGGVEKSCQIMTTEMNPATWKAYALADIVTRLMAKNRSYEWNADMKTLPDNLRTMTIHSLLQVGHLKLVFVILETNFSETCL